MKKVVVAIDGSEVSKSLIEYAFHYAEREKDVELIFLHVIESWENRQIEYKGHVAYLPPPESEIRQQFSEIVEEVRKKTGSLVRSYSVEVRVGISYQEIVDFATEQKARLIMIGHRGISGLRRFIIGSVAAKVVAHTPCSVYVHIPEQVAGEEK